MKKILYLFHKIFNITSMFKIIKHIHLLFLTSLFCFTVSGQTTVTVFSETFSAPNSNTWIDNNAIPNSNWTASNIEQCGSRISGGQLHVTNRRSSSQKHGQGFAYVNCGPGGAFDPQYNSTLNSNSGIITWTFNMQLNVQGRSNSDPLSCSSASSQNGKIAAAFILGSNGTSQVLSSTGNCNQNGTADGYAVIFPVTSTSNIRPRLVRFTNGIYNGTINTIATWNTNISAKYYVSYKVTYNTSTNQWSLQVREDNSGSFNDPDAGTYSAAVTGVDGVYATQALNYMGGYLHAGCIGLCDDAAYIARFDNVKVKITTTCTPPPAPPTVNVVAPTCSANGTASISNHIPGATYTFNPAGPSVNGSGVITGFTFGTAYTVTATHNGCTSDPSSSFTILGMLPTPGAPIVNVVAPTCSANGTASISNHIPGATYTFNPTGPNVDGSGNIGGGISYGTAYTVTVTHNGCTSNSSVSFTIEGMQSASNIDVTATNSEVCQGEPVVLTASGGVSYSWNTGSTDESITVHPTATTTYTVTGTDANGCESTAQVTITVNPLPAVDAGNDIELCIADGIVLTAYNPDGATITWNNGVSDGVPFTQTENTVTYTVTAELNGCTSTDQVTVSISSSLSDVEIATYYEVCLGRQAVIAVNNPIQGYTYSWYYGGIMVGTGSALTINNTSKYDEGQYTLFVENQNGCFEEFDITLNVIDCGVQIPEAFSPNGDGINDYFHIGNLEAYPKSELWIYNRWGIEVYHAENYLNNWDGTSQSSLNMGGDELPEGTYYYVLKLGDSNKNLLGAGKKHNGTVYLKR